MTNFPSHLRTAVHADGAAILDIPRNQITTLNSTGAFVWDKLQQGLTVDQAIRDLAAASDTDPVIVGRDVHSFLDELISRHLLHDSFQTQGTEV